jgi:hypothetical protein
VSAQLALIDYRAGDPCPVDALTRARAALAPIAPAVHEGERLDPLEALAVLTDLCSILAP